MTCTARREEASANTADLASQAAEHAELCSSVLRGVSNAKTQTQSSLDTISRRIACAQQEINESNGLLADMAVKARRHDETAEGNSVVCVAAWQVVISSGADHLPKLLWATFWIPVINMVAIPVSLLLGQYVSILPSQEIDQALINTAERTRTLPRAVETWWLDSIQRSNRNPVRSWDWKQLHTSWMRLWKSSG